MDIIAEILEYVSFGIGIIAFLIILWGVLKGSIEYILTYISRNDAAEDRLEKLSSVRHELGYHLLIALEVLIAADIIRTIIHPELEELAILGVIVAIRVVLSYFLHREISHKISR